MQLFSKSGILLPVMAVQPVPRGELLPPEREQQCSCKTTISYIINAKRDGAGVWPVSASACESGFSSGSASTTFTVSR
jgi:hypothetical protein